MEKTPIVLIAKQIIPICVDNLGYILAVIDDMTNGMTYEAAQRGVMVCNFSGTLKQWTLYCLHINYCNWYVVSYNS